MQVGKMVAIGFSGGLALALVAAHVIGGVKAETTLVAVQDAALVALAIGAWIIARRSRRVDEALRFADDRWRALSGLTGLGIVRHNEQGHVIGSNAAFCRLVGIDPLTLDDATVIRRLHLSSGPAFLKALSDITHGATTASARIRLKCEAAADGHAGPDPYRDMEISLSRVVTDPATGRREILSLYRPLETALEKLGAGALPTLQSARLGHELRTPLTAIIGFAECLGDPAVMAEDDPKRGDYAKLIGTSARHMLDVVNSFAKEAPEAAHQASLGTEAIHLAELVEESAGIMRLMIATQKASLHYQVEANVPVLVGSRHAFRQILINLMSNALKFAPGGTVLVNVWREGGKVRLTVEDNGMGMTAEDVSRLGEPFFRGTAAGDFAPDGQGLGLGIVRSLVRDHHGDFDVMSRPGAGTRVIVTFQIPEALAAPLPSPAPLAARLPVRRYA